MPFARGSRAAFVKRSAAGSSSRSASQVRCSRDGLRVDPTMSEPDRRRRADPRRSAGRHDFAEAWEHSASPGRPGRIARLDRGLEHGHPHLAEARGHAEPMRLRNIGADVAVGDWVVPSDDGERVEHVLERRSAFTRRASFDGMRAGVAHARRQHRRRVPRARAGHRRRTSAASNVSSCWRSTPVPNRSWC